MAQKKVFSNVLKQNCYIRDVVDEAVLSSNYDDRSYTSLDEVVTTKGIEVVKKEVPYPITPQYVNSFVDSADYRRDPVNAVVNSPKRQNLGDISGLQDVLGFDFATAQNLYSALKSKFEAANSQKNTVVDSNANTNKEE